MWPPLLNCNAERYHFFLCPTEIPRQASERQEQPHLRCPSADVITAHHEHIGIQNTKGYNKAISLCDRTLTPYTNLNVTRPKDLSMI